MSTFSCSIDERDLAKAPLSLFHILEVTVDVWDDGETGKGWRSGVEEEAKEECEKFQIYDFNQVQPSVAGKST